MAIGRISGQMLKANLLRSGVDLAFETNLLVLDVTNSYVGIGTATPSRQLHVSGTGALRLPSGTDAQRGTSANGDIRYNTDQGFIEGYSNGAWKNLTDQGIDSVAEDTTPQLGGDLDINGFNITSARSNEDINIIPSGTGSVAITKVDINGGAIDGAVIGANSAAAGTFTSLTSTGLDVTDGDITNVGDINVDSVSSDAGSFDLLLDDNTAAALEIKEGSNAYMTFVTTNSSEQITVDKKLLVSNGVTFESNTVDINGGAIDGTTIGANSASPGTFTNISTNGTVSITGTTTGSMNNVAIGAATAASGKFTTIESSGNVTVGGNLTVNGTTTTIESSTLTIEDPLIILAKNNSGGAGNTYDQGLLFNRGSLSNVSFLWDESADSFVFANTASETGNTAGNVTIDSYAPLRAGATTVSDLTANGIINIDGDGTGDNIDGVIIGANLAAAGTFTTVNASGVVTANGGLTTSGAISIQGDGSTAANIDGITIGGTTPAAGTFTTLTVNTSFSTGRIELVQNEIRALSTNDDLVLKGSGTGSVAMTKVNIDSGNIDNTVIGFNTRTAGYFTSLYANTNIDIDADNASLRIGAGNDLRFTHDGTNSVISNITGSIHVNSPAGSKVWINANETNTDLQVSGDTVANLLYVDASADKIGIATSTPAYTLDAGSATDAIRVPGGNTAARPTAATGVIRFNTQLGVYEGSQDGSTWIQFTMGTGGTIAINKVTATGDGSTSTFNGFFTAAPASANNVMVYIDNVYQEPTENYTVSSNNITFTSAPHSGARIFAIEGFDNTAVQTGGVARTLTESTSFESSATTIMSFNATNYRSAELYVQVTDAANSEYSCMKAHVIHNGTTAYINTYGIVNTGASDSVTLSATYTAGTVNVQAISTGGSSSAIVQYSLAAV